MFTNRISGYYTDAHDVDQSHPESSSPQPPATPRGFVPVPSPLLEAMINAQDLYRAAFEQAQQDARQRLIALLRSRRTN